MNLFDIARYFLLFQTLYMATCFCAVPPADRSRLGPSNICIAKTCHKRQGLVRKRQSVNKDNKGNT